MNVYLKSVALYSKNIQQSQNLKVFFTQNTHEERVCLTSPSNYQVSFHRIITTNVDRKKKITLGVVGSGLSEDGPVGTADVRAAPSASVLRQPPRKKRGSVSRAGSLQQQEDTFTSQTPSSWGEQQFV